MFRIKRCGFFIIITLIFTQSCFSKEDDLQFPAIVVTQRRQLTFATYASAGAQSKGINYQSALENLNFLPVDLQSRSLRSGIQTDFSIRGSTAEQVSVLLNGQRVNDPQTAHYDCDLPFTKADIRRLEVSGASTQAINFVLDQPKQRKIILESGIGSFRDGYGLFSFSDKIKNFGFRYSVEDAQSKGFRYDTDYKKFTTSINTSLELPNLTWETNFGYQDKDYGAYDFYTPGLGYPSQEATRTYLINSGLSLDQAGLLIKPNFLWRRHFDKFTLDKTQLRSLSVNQHR
ncbi:MAG: hypothetical protein M0Q96_04240, partial [Candidatus Omnitrophica bacterium]|nr:hypothetical protein [Candidatus Omnitrophota bacterium]